MNFERAVELRRQGLSYNKIGEAMGCSGNAVRYRFIQQYNLGNLLELSGYRGADRQSNPKNRYGLRHGPCLLVGGPVLDQLTQTEKWDAALLMSKRGHRTLNEMLVELLRKELS